MTVKGHFANPARIKAARLAANMSRGDLAFAIRQHTGGAIKTTERGVAGWENKEYAPSDGVIPAIAAVTGKEIGFFYEADSDDDGDEGRALLRDLRDLPLGEEMPLVLRRRIERFIEPRSAVSSS